MDVTYDWIKGTEWLFIWQLHMNSLLVSCWHGSRVLIIFVGYLYGDHFLTPMDSSSTLLQREVLGEGCTVRLKQS